MKRFILLITIFIYNISFAETYNYTELKNYEDFYGIFILSDKNHPDTKVKLDCQSYFHKMDILDSQNNILVENYITFGECEALYYNYKNCIQSEKIKCIDSENIFNEDCKCE